MARVVLIRKNLYLGRDQYNLLKKQEDLNVSEHIRRAIDEYVERLLNKNVMTSSSKGEQND